MYARQRRVLNTPFAPCRCYLMVAREGGTKLSLCVVHLWRRGRSSERQWHLWKKHVPQNGSGVSRNRYTPQNGSGGGNCVGECGKTGPTQAVCARRPPTSKVCQICQTGSVRSGLTEGTTPSRIAQGPVAIPLRRTDANSLHCPLKRTDDFSLLAYDFSQRGWLPGHWLRLFYVCVRSGRSGRS